RSRAVLEFLEAPIAVTRQTSRLIILFHCCPAKAGCADSKRRAGNELSLFRACRDLKRRSGWFGRRGRQTMARETAPHRLFAIDQLPSRPGVPPLRRALSGRPPAARIFLLGSVSGHGLRATDLSGKFARHRGLSAFDAGQAVPPGIPRQGGALDAGRRERIA